MGLERLRINKAKVSLYLVGTLSSIAVGIIITALRADLSAILWYLLFVVVILPVFVDRLILRRSIDLFEPVYLSALTYVVHFVGPLAGSIFLGVEHPLFPQLNFNPAMIFTTIGLLSFYWGYYIVRLPAIRTDACPTIKKQGRWSKRKILIVVSVYCGITIVSLSLFWFPRYGGLEGYLALLYGVGATNYAIQGLGYAKALLFLAVSAFHLTFLNILISSKPRHQAVDWLLFIFAGLVSTASMLLTGNRVFILWNFGVPIVIWHYFKRRLSFAVIVGGLGLAFVVVLGYTSFVRSPGSLNLASSSVASDLISFYVTQTAEALVVSDFIDRQANVLGFQYGGTLLATLANPIPRALYPTKPPTAGEIYTRYFHPDIWRSAVTYLGVPWIGELYMNGGPLGVILGMAVTGILWRKIYSYFTSKRSLIAHYKYAMAVFCLYFLIVRGSLQATAFPLLWLIPTLIGIGLISKTR
jgi:oligosaccharide repeat unit polymerase